MFHFLLTCFTAASFFVFSFNPFQSGHNQNNHHPRPKPTKPSPIVTAVPTLPISLTPSPSASVTPTLTITATPTATLTLMPTLTPTPTATPSPTLKPTATHTPTPTPIHTPTPTHTPMPTITPALTATVTPPVLPTATPTNDPTPTLTVAPTMSATPSPTMDITPTASPTPTLTPSPTETPPPTPTEVPTPTPTITKIGNDISYPQCGKTYPTGQGFGIVGVNGGIATTTNPCLSSQLMWANMSLATPGQAKTQLYVNTGNPGGLNTPSWPQNNTDPVGNASPNPFGTCDGSDSVSCAWQYGWNRAVDDVQNKFIPAAQAAGVGIDTNPVNYPWWLDVETTNSWKSGSDFAYQSNRAVLEGMVSYFQSKGITVGVYSTSYQWGVILNSIPPGSNLNGLRSWLAGASGVAGAQSYCSLSPLTSGGSVIMTQFVMDAFDYDYSCL
jgi:hypothetical protein